MHRFIADKYWSELALKYENEQKTCPPDLKEAFKIKHQKVVTRIDLIMNENKVGKILDSLEEVFDQIAARLEKSKKGKANKTSERIFFKFV